MLRNSGHDVMGWFICTQASSDQVFGGSLQKLSVSFRHDTVGPIASLALFNISETFKSIWVSLGKLRQDDSTGLKAKMSYKIRP